MSWGCAMLVGLLEAWENGCCLFLLDNMALVLGASKGRGSMPNLNHTCREILCHLSRHVHHLHLQMDCVRR